ncbi:hypothetical protein QTP70_012537 [Hemibagrus guttatus]|uniref:Uncharacterized protein n=1 Tax=Hemibagrus guttatus TaxID=175788 RepID=A0AAE0QB76_9TELE|nr:hypothetical protein QTP70_012537 [Hemibagrus guttatus]
MLDMELPGRRQRGRPKRSPACRSLFKKPFLLCTSPQSQFATVVEEEFSWVMFSWEGGREKEGERKE